MYDVMIIDDEIDVREHLISVIDWKNLPIRLVAQAADYDTAKELYLLHQPKIIITDINLSMGSGLDLAEEFMKLDPTIQCIVITGYSDVYFAQRALRMGAVEFLLKPIFANTINESMKKAIDRFETLRKQEASVESMRQLLNENSHTVRNAYLGRLFRFGEEGAGSANLKFRELHIDCPGPYYAVALLTLARSGQLERYESACLLMEKQLQKMLQESGLQSHLFFDSYFRLTCLVGSEDSNLDTTLEIIITKLKSYLYFLDDFRLMAGISCSVAGTSRLKDAFSQAKVSFNFQNVLSDDSVIHYKNVNAYEPIQVDSQVGDGEQRLLPGNQPGLGLHGLLRAQEHCACQGQGAIHPGIENGTAIGLYAELAAAAGELLRVGLDLQAGPIRMGGGNAEVIRGLAQGEGRQEAAALDIVLTAGDKGKGCGQIQGGEARLLQGLGGGLNAVVGGDTGIQPAEKILYIPGHRLSSCESYSYVQYSIDPPGTQRKIRDFPTSFFRKNRATVKNNSAHRPKLCYNALVHTNLQPF